MGMGMRELLGHVDAITSSLSRFAAACHGTVLKLYSWFLIQ
jgi:hypothetical protein